MGERWSALNIVLHDVYIYISFLGNNLGVVSCWCMFHSSPWNICECYFGYVGTIFTRQDNINICIPSVYLKMTLIHIMTICRYTSIHMLYAWGCSFVWGFKLHQLFGLECVGLWRPGWYVACVLRDLGGGLFLPRFPGKMDPIWRCAYFSEGLVQPPTRFCINVTHLASHTMYNMYVMQKYVVIATVGIFWIEFLHSGVKIQVTAQASCS